MIVFGGVVMVCAWVARDVWIIIVHWKLISKGGDASDRGMVIDTFGSSPAAPEIDKECSNHSTINRLC